MVVIECSIAINERSKQKRLTVRLLWCITLSLIFSNLPTRFVYKATCEVDMRSDETGVYGTLGVITSVPSLSLRDMDRMVPPPALKYTK